MTRFVATSSAQPRTVPQENDLDPNNVIGEPDSLVNGRNRQWDGGSLTVGEQCAQS